MAIELDDLHWMLDIVQHIDVGVLVINRAYEVEIWNSFMENHSGVLPSEAQGRQLFDLFPDMDRDWFRYKVESVAMLGTPMFTIWEQRPYLIRFKNYQPITGMEDHMFQNVTILPLHDTRGNVGHIGVIIYDVTRVATNTRQLQSVNSQLEELSRTDRLTGLFNRGFWEECLTHEFARHQRYRCNVSLVMIDIDHFKKINDTYGHPGGDKVIQALAALIGRQVRTTDRAGRYGGEEFVVLTTETPCSGAQVFAERLRQQVELLTVEHEEHTIRFTVSVGVAESDLSQPLDTYGALIECADQALYQSKHNGRNQVTVYSKG
ncbi:diguanylate cyclase (GGDEF)-like protein [Pseudomonas duriflava]|uniref:diguanylate cyclase n=1 Tax=Pseudomonas duriflava TaxID=459528 RepID=A0A562PPF1_9PSED|nr:sensor domain-containing diguanylate cyclase [Pseudomonas duriflava]TWI46335.1 diguanylate cyclase (GGDEF)-like protein [Pseudomonas duriflava]